MGSYSRRSVLRASGGAGIAAVAGCLSSGGDDGGDAVRIGALSPVSGSFEAFGRNQRRGIELAVEEADAREGLPPVEATFVDSEGDPSTARTRAIELIEEEGVDYLVGTISSDVAPALNHVAAQHDVVFAAGAAGDAVTGRECNEYVFRLETSVSQIAQACAPWTIENLGSSVWFHLMDYAYGESIINEWRSRMGPREGDLDLAGVSRSPLTEDDYGEYLDRIEASDAEVLVVGMIAGPLAAFGEALIERGLHEELTVMTTTASLHETRETLGPAAAGIYSGVRYDTSLETGDNAAFVAAYEEANDSRPDSFAQSGYDSVRMLTAGIDEAGTTDPETVAETLPGLIFETVFGETEIRECDHQAAVPTWIGRLEAEGADVGVELLERVSPEEASPDCETTGCEL